jgi:hypothetical protein
MHFFTAHHAVYRCVLPAAQLPTRPCFYDIDIDLKTGKIVGLS